MRLCVIPGRTEGANPKSRDIHSPCIDMDSGFAAFAAPRNDVVRVA